jgi:hypothetical protein
LAVPASWEGWTATAAFITVFGATAALVRGWLRWVLAAIIVGVFAGIACSKTEGGCRWRWGKI